MKHTTRRIKALETQKGKSEPIIINIHKTVIGMDGKVARVEEEAVTIGAWREPGRE